MPTDELLLHSVVPEEKTLTASLAILYEHPAWFERLFSELDRRGTAYERLLATDHFFDPEAKDRNPKVLFNRTSPSADRREHGSAILYTQSYLVSRPI